jgi:2-amino-4-hydroxy-6-hydroxymethyldihydropteridine diphosphokinase
VAEWAFVALGSNLGDRDRHLAMARDRLAHLPDTTVHAVSRIEETDPIGPGPQPRYRNQMVLLCTELPPQTLLDYCHAIEDDAGRRRTARWEARTLDLDIVRFGDHVRAGPHLMLPHPEIEHRPFWQRELAELEPHVR